MTEQLKNVMVHAGASWVLWLLAGVSVLSLAAKLDRVRVFWTEADVIPALVSTRRYRPWRKRLSASFESEYLAEFTNAVAP
jgi:hypothetical protein